MFPYWQHNRAHTCWITRHYHFNIVVKLISIWVLPQTSVKKTIRILFLLFKRIDIEQFLLFTCSFQTQKVIISFITLCPIQDRGGAAKLLIRNSTGQWVRHSEYCSCVWFPFNSFGWYYLVFISFLLFYVFCHSWRLFTSVVLHSSIQMKKLQWCWKHCSNILMVQDIFALFFRLCLQHCTIISAVFIISSDSKHWNY